MSRALEYYNEVRAANKQVWEGALKLKSLQREYVALDYGTTLPAEVEGHDGVTPQEVGAVVFDTANALVTLLEAGHATNMSKLL